MHQAIVGSCGHVIAQCRCPGPKQPVTREHPCDACARDVHGQTKTDFYPNAGPEARYVRLDWQTLALMQTRHQAGTRLHAAYGTAISVLQDLEAQLNEYNEERFRRG